MNKKQSELCTCVVMCWPRRSLCTHSSDVGAENESQKQYINGGCDRKEEPMGKWKSRQELVEPSWQIHWSDGGKTEKNSRRKGGRGSGSGSGEDGIGKIDVNFVVELYEDYIIPLTKEVEVGTFFKSSFSRWILTNDARLLGGVLVETTGRSLWRRYRTVDEG